jgi:hypothetical protein
VAQQACARQAEGLGNYATWPQAAPWSCLTDAAGRIPVTGSAESRALLRRMTLPGCAYSCAEPTITAVLVLQDPSLAQATPNAESGVAGSHAVRTGCETQIALLWAWSAAPLTDTRWLGELHGPGGVSGCCTSN